MKRILTVFALFFSFVFAQNGLGDYALSFDGIDDYVTTDAALVNFENDMTIEAWFNTTDTNSYNSIATIEKYNAGTNDFLQILTNASGNVYLKDANDATLILTTESYNDGKWHHVAFVRNTSSKTIYLYVDGALKGSETYTTSAAVDPDDELRFGNSEYQGGNYYMDGLLDEIKIWDDVRTAEEIREFMYKDATGEAGLLAYYQMSDGTGTSLTDNTGNGNTGTLTNGPIWAVSTCFGGSRQALDFDGTDDYVDCGTMNLSGTTVTIEGWVNADNFNDPGQNCISLFGTEQSNNSAFLRLGDGGEPIDLDQVQFVVYIAGQQKLNGNLKLQANTWYHIAGVYDAASGMKIYINGKLDASNSQSGAFISNDLFYIGNNNIADTRFLDGCIDEVRVWTTARTQTEIQENMMKTLVGNEAGLEAYYRFDQMEGTTVYDITSNGNNGTLTSMDDATDWVDGGAFSTWIGTESTTWATDANWTDGSPASTQSAGIYDWTVGALTTYEATISGSPSMHSLFLSSTSTPTMSSDITLGGSLILQRNLDQDANNITLGSSGYLTETGGTLTGSTGYIQTTRAYTAAITAEDIANLGATITTDISMGSTNIKRGYSNQSATGLSSSVDRYYDITPTTNTGLNATLVFPYLDGELNGITEADLELHKSTDGGTNWTNENGTVTTGSNIVTLSGIDGFSRWTAGISAEMNIQGNNTNIADGDATPATTDYTDFGNVDITNGADTRTFTIQNTGTGPLTITTPITVTGAGFSCTYQPTSPVAAGGSSTFTIQYDPSTTGTGIGAISIDNNDGDENPYNFSIQGTGTDLSPNGLGNYALEFDGTDDYVVMANGPDLSDDTFTIECWAKKDNISSTNIFIGQGNANQPNESFYLGVSSSGQIFVAQITPTSVVRSDAGTVSDTKWHHYAVAKTGVTTVNVYLDGKLIVQDTDNDGNSLADYTPTSDRINLGVAPWNLSSSPHDGYIDEVRIWDDVRTQAEIIENMYKDATGESNLVAYYKMSEGTGTSLTDNSPNGNIGTLNGGTTWKASGCFGGSRQALDFDGTDDYVELGSPATLDQLGQGSYTLEAWIKTDASNTRQTIIGNYDGSPAWVLELYTSGNLRTYVNNTGYNSSAEVADNNWHHVATVRDFNNNILMYVDGEEVYNYGSDPEGSFTVTHNTMIGRNPSGSYPLNFDGQIDEIRVWNDVRTQTEILENMMKTLTGNEANLVSYYRFDQMEGTTLYDMTSNSLDGTLTNMDDATDWVDGGAFSIWVGTASTDWATDANWTDGSPAATQSAGIYDWTVGALTTYEATISGSPSMHSLFLSSTSTPVMSSSITLSGSLILQKNLDLTSNNITLGSSGKLIETGGILSGTTGYIQTTRTLSNISTENVANLGATLTTTANMGSTNIKRGYSAQSGTGIVSSVNRYYDITPTNNSGLSATLKFNYRDSELNGITESDLKLYKSSNGGTSWTEEGGTVTTGSNIVTLTGINGFSRWTAGFGGSEIDVKGNNAEISNGDNTPTTADHTDFTNVSLSGGTIQRTFTIYNTGPQVLTITTPITVTGDFTCTTQPTTSVAASGNTTFTIEFDPSTVGTRSGTISIENNDSDENPYYFSICGEGTTTPPTGADNSISIAEGQSHTFQQSDFSYNDSDGDSMAAVNIVSIPAKGTFQYKGSPVAADVDYLDVTKLIYTPIPGENGSPYATFSFKVKDQNGAYSETYTITINVDAGDSPPYAANPLPDVTVEEEADNYTIHLDTLFTDPDNNDIDIVCSILSNSDTSMVSTSIVDKKLTLSFYENNFGSAELIIQGLSNKKTAVDTFLVNVTDINDAPFGGDAEITILENSSYTFKVEDFLYTDLEDDEFDGIQMLTLVDKGTMKCYDEEVKVSNKYYPMVNKLTFTPEVDSFATPYTSFNFKVRDKRMAFSDSIYTMTINVRNVDYPPTVNTPIADVFVEEDAAQSHFLIDSLFADPDDSKITKSIVSISDSCLLVTSILEDTLLIDYKPNMFGNCEIVIKGQSNALWTTDTFVVNITPVNDPPVGKDDSITVNEETIFNFSKNDFSYSDVDNDEPGGIKLISSVTKGNLSYEDTEVEADTTYQDVTKLKFVPLNNEIGNPYTSFTYKLMDEQGAYSDSTYRMNIIVANVNDAPVLTTILPDTTIYENSTLTFDYDATDNDSSPLIFSISAIDIASEIFSNMKIDSLSGIFSWRPTYNDAGTYSIGVSVTDMQIVVTDTLVITVLNVNDAPVLTTLLPDTTIYENTTLTFDYDATDSDSDSLFFSISAVDITPESFLNMKIDSLSGIYSWSPNYNDAGVHSIGVFVTDMQITATDTLIITVLNVNRAPQFTNTINDTTVNNDTLFTCQYEATDPDGDELEYGILTPFDSLAFSDTGFLSWKLSHFTGDTEQEVAVFVTDNEDTVTTSANITIHDVINVAVDAETELPDKFELVQSYPNPFNPTTNIRFNLPQSVQVNISVYDISGKLVTTLVNKQVEAGYHNITWDASGQSTGIYFYRIIAGDFVNVKKCLLVK